MRPTRMRALEVFVGFFMKAKWEGWEAKEFMARPLDSTLTNSLPILKRYGASGFTWGLFQGRSNTHVAWNTWLRSDTRLDIWKKRVCGCL